MLTYDQYVVAKSLNHVFDILDANPASRIIAGATDLLPWARYGRAGDVHLPSLIDVSRVADLTYIKSDSKKIYLGANTTIADFQNNPQLRTHAPVLAQCAVWFADDQIREQATVAGNVVNASPAGDSQPALLSLNTAIKLIRREQGKIIERTIPLQEFILGPGKTLLEPKELVLGFECDSALGFGSAYEKVGHRRSLVISTVCLAVVAKVNPAKNIVEDIRIGIGAVGPVPKRLHKLEKRLIAEPITSQLIREIAEAGSEDVQSRSRQEYRREVLVNFIERAIISALNEAGLPLVRFGEERLCA
jgi:CO/xanthine dehydrogenase FAD-binding subunit